MTYSELLKHYGSQSAIARAVGIRPPSVWEWKKAGVPEHRQLEFHRLTNGQLKADREIVKKYQALLAKAA